MTFKKLAKLKIRKKILKFRFTGDQIKALQIMDTLDMDLPTGYRCSVLNKVKLIMARSYAGEDPIELFKKCKMFLYPELKESEESLDKVLQPLRDLMAWKL